MDNLYAVLIGLGTGFASALASWWLLTQHWRPRLEIDPTIAKYRFTDDPPGEFRYQVRVRNTGRRPAVDLYSRIRLKIEGLVREGSTENIDITARISPQIKTGPHPLLYRVRLDDIADFRRDRYAKYLGERFQDAFRAGEYVDLDELLEAYPKARVEVSVLSSDGYTWSRAVCINETRSIEDGKFNGDGALGHTGEVEIPADRGALDDDND